jgi:hypothetical protein
MNLRLLCLVAALAASITQVSAEGDGVVTKEEFANMRGAGGPPSGAPKGRPTPGGSDASDGLRQRMQRRVESQGIQQGESVSDAEVFTLDGNAVRLSSLWRDKPLALVTASLTCPISVRECPALAELKAKHDPRVNFAVLYVKEAHPAESDKPGGAPARDTGAVASGVGAATQPATLEDRRKLAAGFARSFSGEAPVYMADIGNRLTQRLGTGPNTGLLIHTNGVLRLKQGWFNAAEMSEAVVKLLGDPMPSKSRTP